MGKVKYVKHPRSIVRKRHDHPSSLFIFVPAKIIKQWSLHAGHILEFVFVTEDVESYIKVKRIDIPYPFQNGMLLHRRFSTTLLIKPMNNDIHYASVKRKKKSS